MFVFHWFDDYILGAVLLAAALYVWRGKENATEYLIAAWGIAAGALALSLLGQLDGYFKDVADAGIFSSGLVVIAKAVILLFIFIGLHHSIKASTTAK